MIQNQKNNKNPNSTQSFVEYVQQNRNSTKSSHENIIKEAADNIVKKENEYRENNAPILNALQTSNNIIMGGLGNQLYSIGNTLEQSQRESEAFFDFMDSDLETKLSYYRSVEEAEKREKEKQLQREQLANDYTSELWQNDDARFNTAKQNVLNKYAKSGDFSNLYEDVYNEALAMAQTTTDDSGIISHNGNQLPVEDVAVSLYDYIFPHVHVELMEQNRKYAEHSILESTGLTYKEYMTQRADELIAELESLEDQAVAANYREWEDHLGEVAGYAVALEQEIFFRNYFEEKVDQVKSWRDNSFWSGAMEGDILNALSLGVVDAIYTPALENRVIDIYERGNVPKKGSTDWYVSEAMRLSDELNDISHEVRPKQSGWNSFGSGLSTTGEELGGFALGMGFASKALKALGWGSKAASTYRVAKAVNTAKNATGLGKVKALGNYALESGKVFIRNRVSNFGRDAAISGVAIGVSPSTYARVQESWREQYRINNDGTMTYTPKSAMELYATPIVNQWAEYYSELWGAAFYDDLVKMSPYSMGNLLRFNKNTKSGAVATAALTQSKGSIGFDLMRKAGFSGSIGSEIIGEAYGDVISTGINSIYDKNYNWKSFSDPNYWTTLAGVSLVLGGSAAVLNTQSYVKRINYIHTAAKNRDQALNDIKDPELKERLTVLANSNPTILAMELANTNWEGIKDEDKKKAFDFVNFNTQMQVALGYEEEGSRLSRFENTRRNIEHIEYKKDGKSTGFVVTAVDNTGKKYYVINESTNSDILECVNTKTGVIEKKKASDITITKDDISLAEAVNSAYQEEFSIEIETDRILREYEEFLTLENPSTKAIDTIMTSFGITKPDKGDIVELLDGTKAEIIKDEGDGNFIIGKNDEYGNYTTERTRFTSIISNDPVTAAAQRNIGNLDSALENITSTTDSTPKQETKLFDEEGILKAGKDQIISELSLADPDVLEDYISKVSDRVSPEIKQSIDDSLKLSRVYKEINDHLSNLVQTKKNRERVESLSDILKNTIVSSNPNITAEKLLESIINNKTYNSKTRHDFKNILKALTNAKVQRRTTTKTDTSKTQKDVKGKRGRKQIEKGIKDLKEAFKDNDPIEALNAINWIDETLSKVEEEPITDKEKQFVEETRKTLKEQGYEIHPMRGMNYHEGMKVTVHFTLNPELPAGTQIIKEVRKPQINKDGVMVQAAEIVVEQGPAIEEETPDISQAVTKEMTGEEPMDFSEPTDNTVESKKEDSVTPDLIEPNPLIPELESAFKKVDTENMSETPSREEEVETLTEEQRREVTIQDSVNPNMREFKVDSILPDDITADEVIPDKHEVQGNRIYRYDGKQLREERKQVRRIPNRPNDEHGSFYKWLEDNNTDLQGIIDNELSEIASLDPDVKFMMLTEGTKSGYPAGSKILNVVFQVVEYTDAIKKIHKESRGGIITSEGTKYLVIGTTGFRPALEGVFNPELNHYSFLADTVLKAARNQYTSNTNEIEREAYYVHPSMSTKIKDIQAGWITTQTENDSSVQERPLIELFNDETRNPHGIKIGDSKWLIPTKNESKPITVRVNPNDVVHGLQIPTGLAGAVFLLVPAANGHYIPVSVKTGKTNELSEGKLKDAIWNTAKQLLSDDPDIRNYSIKELCKLLNLTKEGYNIIIDDKDIDFDSKVAKFKIKITSGGIPFRIIEVDPLNIFDANTALSDALFSKDDTKGIPFQLNIGLQTLTTSSELEMYMESGSLKTEAAVLGTVNASYTVHSIDMNLKADPYTEQSTDSQEGSYNDSPLRRGQGNGVIYIGKNQYFRFAENSYMDIKEGEVVTDAVTLKKIEKHLWLEKHKPTPAKVEKGSGIKLYILSKNEVMAVTKNGDISFITDKDRVDGIIKSIKEETDNKVRAINAKEELSHVEEQQQAEQEIPRMLQEEQEADVPEVDFTEDFDSFKDTEVTPVEGSFEEVSFDTREEYNPKEKVSETLTEGVVENVSAEQLPTTDYLRGIQNKLIKEGMTKKEARAIIGEAFEKLKEYGLDTYYTSADESIILSTIDVLIHCRNK